VFWLLRSVGLLAYVVLAAGGHASIAAIMWCESLTMASVVGLWIWAWRRRRACQDLCVSCYSVGLAEVGAEPVGVGQGEGSEGLFPALDAGSFDEPVGGFALVAG